MNRFDQAVKGLDVVVGDATVRVMDGGDTWFAGRAEWDAAKAKMERLPAFESEEGGVDAYDALCTAVSGVVLSRNGTDRGSLEERRALASGAIAEGLLDEDDAARWWPALGMSTATVMGYDTGAELDGEASADLVRASLEAGDTGAVPAYRDADGVWQYVRPDDVGSRSDVVTVYVQE